MPRKSHSWLVLAFALLPLLALAQAPPVVRSVLTTNPPAFGSAGQALFRTTALPFLNWSNLPAGAFILLDHGLGTNTTFYQSNNFVPVTIIPVTGTATNLFEIRNTNGTVVWRCFVVNSNWNVGIGTNDPKATLHIVGDGTETNLIQAGTNLKDIKFRVSTNGDVLVNLNSAFAAPSIAGTALSVRGEDNSQVRIGYSSYGVAGLGAFAGRHGRGTAGSLAPVQAGDVLISAEGWGYGSTAYSVSPRVMFRGYAGDTWSDTVQPSYASVWTTPLGSASPQERIRVATNGMIGIGTNGPNATLHVTGDNTKDFVAKFGTTNRYRLAAIDTNGNTTIAGTVLATNGLAYMVSNSFIGNLVIVTNNPQIYCVNGTNQLLTLPDCTKIPIGQIIRFSSTNGYGSFVLTNATGGQTIRDGTSLDYKGAGVASVAFFNDGAAWWIASKAKTIWANASWSTSTNVPFTVATSNYITFDTLETSNGQGISLTNGYQIYVRDPGQYLLTFSLVMQTGHNNDTNRVWLQQSGINIPRTRTDIKMPNTTEQIVMTVNFVLPVVTNLTWYAICLRSTDTGAQLVTGAAASAIMPAMPSAIVTINKISDTFP